MTSIDLVIKIDEDIAQGIMEGNNDEPRNIVKSFQTTIADAIKKGKPLPKGHGDLIDRSMLPTNYITYDDIANATAIIEADNVESENA